MSTHKMRGTWAIVALGVAARLVLVGCEKTSRKATLAVTPSVVTLARAGETAVVMASLPGTEGTTASATNNPFGELLYPLAWSVAYPDQGRIISSAGDSAVYYADVGGGNNIITVRDAGGREGLANVN